MVTTLNRYRRRETLGRSGGMGGGRGRFTVGGLRVIDRGGQLRGLSVWVSDTIGSQLYINAVRVAKAPAVGAARSDGSTVRRWVVRSKSGLWLVEADTAGACGDPDQYAVMTHLAVHRVRAAELRL